MMLNVIERAGVIFINPFTTYTKLLNFKKCVQKLGLERKWAYEICPWYMILAVFLTCQNLDAQNPGCDCDDTTPFS